MTTPSHRGLVLSGGGLRGTFTAGALGYLFGQDAYYPDIVTGTSIGSWCGGTVAQARTAAEFHEAASRLRKAMSAIGHHGVAVTPRPWLARLADTRAGSDVGQALMSGMVTPPPADPTMEVDVLAALPGTSTSTGDLIALMGHMLSHPHLRKEIPENDSSLMLLDPIEAAWRGLAPDSPLPPIDQEAVSRPGLTLRLTVTALGDSCIRYVDQRGAMVEMDGVTPAPGAPAPGVIEGMLASASVPAMFAPRTIGDDVYVDGGIVQNIPLTPALDAGAEEVVVVLAEERTCPPPDRDYATADLLSVAYRAQSYVAFFDQQRRDLAAGSASGVHTTVIEPIVDVVGAFDPDERRMTINWEYGWLRAAAARATATTDDRRAAEQAADLVTIGRTRLAWFDGGAASGSDALAASVEVSSPSAGLGQSRGAAVPRTTAAARGPQLTVGRYWLRVCRSLGRPKGNARYRPTE